MNAVAGIQGVRIDLTPDEAMSIARFLKARRVGGPMSSADIEAIHKFEGELATCVVTTVKILEPHISAEEVAELHRDFIQEMCPSCAPKPTLTERALVITNDMAE